VSVAGSTVLTPDMVQPASAQLNSILAAAGIMVSAIAPQVTTSEAQETVTATAVSVSINQPGPPQQTVIYNLGNVFADDLAVPNLPAVDMGALGSLSGTTLTPPESTTESAGLTSSAPAAVTPPAGVSPGATSGATAPKKRQPVMAAAAPVAAKPTWLLIAYLLWQMLIVGTLASLWWWRNTARKLPLPGGRP
jgi:hypothetical protein